MANPQALIDKALTFYDNVGPNDAENATRRARLLLYLQHVYAFVRGFKPWQWTYKETTIPWLANTNSFSLADPAWGTPGFLAFSTSGSLFDTDRKIRLTERSRYIGARLRRELSLAGNAATEFSIWGNAIQLPYAPSSNVNMIAFHRFKAAILADDATEMDIPDEYADTVLLAGLIARSAEGKNDVRDIWNGQFKDGLSQMCATENPLNNGSVHRMPLANRGW